VSELQRSMTPSYHGRSLTSLEHGRGYDPFLHAELLGIQVIEDRLTRGHEIWMPEFHTIVLEKSLRAVHKRNALAHGLGHAVLGHVDDRPKHEHQADRFAAANLIDPVEFNAVIAWAPDLDRLVSELGVTRRLVLAYLEVFPVFVPAAA
jgi:Zn-dependent peptidase ImmA (M78 family)